ncbi:uncharacterized protein TNCV_870521 [Trichonephila clavipes]|nr:uncharacterized protein TNCV_870521 [Trichonephila clavipes]
MSGLKVSKSYGLLLRNYPSECNKLFIRGMEIPPRIFESSPINRTCAPYVEIAGDKLVSLTSLSRCGRHSKRSRGKTFEQATNDIPFGSNTCTRVTDLISTNQSTRYYFFFYGVHVFTNEGLGLNPGEDMDVGKCVVPLRLMGSLNSRRDSSSLVKLVEGEDRWDESSHYQGFLPQNWGRTEPDQPAWCSKLRLTSVLQLAPCHDEFRGP